MTFKSKVGVWYWAVLVFCWVLPAWVGWHHVSTGGPFGLPIFLVIIAALLPTWMLNTRYVFEEDHLLVVCGPFRSRIAYASIVSVKETNNPLSGAALSLDRLEIRGSRGLAALVSPEEKERFVEELKARSGIGEGDA